MKRRELLHNDHSSQVMATQDEKIRHLESDREKLIKDNISLIKQIEHFKESQIIKKSTPHHLKVIEDRCRYLERQVEDMKRDKMDRHHHHNKPFGLNIKSGH